MKKFLGVVAVLLLAVSFVAACGPGAPAEFTLSGVTVSPAAPVVNDTVTIGTTVTNAGEQSGDCDVSLTIGDYTDSKSVSALAGGASTPVSFSYAATTAGDYTAELSTPDDSKSKSFTVSAGEITPPTEGLPIWSVGDTWKYECSYENPEGSPKYEKNEMTVTMAGEASAGEEEGVTQDSYYLTADFVPDAARDAGGLPFELKLTVPDAEIWINKANLQYFKQISPIVEFGMAAGVTWAYTPVPPWSTNVGDTWDFTKHTVAGSLIDSLWDRQGKILGVESITVPAGTFSCYHIVEYDPKSPNTYTYEHWVNATVVKSDVKQIDRDTWAGAETRVLTSYSVS